MSFIARLIVRVAGTIGTMIAALAICIAGIYALSLGGAGLLLLSDFSKDSPALGVSILVALVVFCLYCAFRTDKAASTNNVLRGPVVIKTDKHTVFIQPQQGSGEAPPNPEGGSATITGEP